MATANRGSRLPVYSNETGPGEYEVQSTIGRLQTPSNRRTSPMYSFKLKTYGQVISKEHVQDWICKDTPGSGAYEAKKLDLG